MDPKPKIMTSTEVAAHSVLRWVAVGASCGIKASTPRGPNGKLPLAGRRVPLSIYLFYFEGEMVFWEVFWRGASTPRGPSGKIPLADKRAPLSISLFCFDREMVSLIRWTGLAPWMFQLLFSGSLTSTFLAPLNI